MILKTEPNTWINTHGQSSHDTIISNPPIFCTFFSCIWGRICEVGGKTSRVKKHFERVSPFSIVLTGELDVQHRCTKRNGCQSRHGGIGGSSG
uniref:Uncharacterized protein n=1 Tax=Arundo donax TaxID=35708 RepID=A0A0A9D7Y5_ARUDO